MLNAEGTGADVKYPFHSLV